MEEKKLTKEQIKGVTICVKALQKRYNFILGWEPSEDYERYENTLFIDIHVDYEMVSDYFGVNIRPRVRESLKEKNPYYYKMKIYSLLSLMDMPIDSHLSFDIKKKMTELLNDIYKHVPDNLKKTYIYNSTYGGDKEYTVKISVFDYIIQ